MTVPRTPPGRRRHRVADPRGTDPCPGRGRYRVTGRTHLDASQQQVAHEPERLAGRPPRHSALGEIWHLARSDASISAADPLGDQTAVLLRRLLPREMTGV